MLLRITFLLILFSDFNTVKAQNFVPNGGFEYYTAVPVTLGDFYVTDWKSCGADISPDFFCELSPATGAANPAGYYSQVKPAGGIGFAGMILEDEKHQYREPITSRLATTLREDSTYLLKISIAIPYSSCFRINSCEILFSETIIYDWETVKPEDYVTMFTIPLDSVKDNFSWFTYKFEFQALGTERYISIGNFKSVKDSKLIKLQNRKEETFKEIYNQAYICIDNVELYDVALMTQQEEFEPEEEPVAEESTLETLVLENLQFEVGSAILRAEEIPELDKAVAFLLAHEEVTIHITGHTDNSGNKTDNTVLSIDRANSVSEYFIERGIDESRITTFGFGSADPVATNETEEGRTKNRRVVIEFFGQ